MTGFFRYDSRFVRLPLKFPLLAAAVACLAAAGCNAPPAPSKPPETPSVSVAEPPPELAEGRALYDRNCSRCHGPGGTGSASGPPLVDKIYAPDHHVDISFRRAVQFGARAHHWRFGDMPPVTGVSPGETDRIIAYIRWLQKQAGIH